MATRYLIGRGELLTYPIKAPKTQPGEKKHPYTLAEAKKELLPQLDAANDVFESLPRKACPGDLAVALVTLHPAYLAKSYFPRHLLRAANLESVGSRTMKIKPRKLATASAPPETETTQLFVAGRRSDLKAFRRLVAGLSEETAEGQEFKQIETIEPLEPKGRLRPSRKRGSDVFEVGLHVPNDGDSEWVRAAFANYAQTCEFTVNPHFSFRPGRMLFVPVEGDRSGLDELAQFTLVRVIRPMPRLRAARPMMRSNPVSVPFDLPIVEPISMEPKVAILDGGLPEQHLLQPYVRRYFVADEKADDVDDYVSHGLGVTSALLFGPIEPDSVAPRPYAPVDHHRVIDSLSDDEDPYELYRTLGHVEAILLARSYQYVNLSMGPDLCVEDHEVHAWTAVIDEILSNGETVLSVAVGNNGEGDELAGLNRIQVPADSVNALSVGAVDRSGETWKRAPYSAVGPGRSPGRRKPDLVAFGGSGREYFHVVAPGRRRQLNATLGTSFAAPLALRAAVGIRAVLGQEVRPLATKALLIHGCIPNANEDVEAVGWGKVPNELRALITCEDGVARIVYQGDLNSGKFLRAPVPLPDIDLNGMVTITATFCYASPVDPQDASAYTKAGLGITFRPHSEKKPKVKPVAGKKEVDPASQYAKSFSFFPSNEWRTEAEQRADLGKWETVLHSSHNFRGSSLKGAVFDVHYNARDSGAPLTGREQIPYALVITVQAPRHPDLYQQILDAHVDLQALVPAANISINL
ncbi:S8 family peptidase [Roseateles sp.]|uniref:S8 family peptidase n=1 Tax=Roseateles sp. TaxID=1971397 RepID=UPI0025DC10B6|nr:S8 family peptidase [Roseateles sp.]MBV8035535.1 S8 family peptidase [Roseateles sp.]